MQELPQEFEEFVEKIKMAFHAAKMRFETIEARVASLEEDNRRLKKIIQELDKTKYKSSSQPGSTIAKCPTCHGLGFSSLHGDAHNICLVCGGKGKVRI